MRRLALIPVLLGTFLPAAVFAQSSVATGTTNCTLNATTVKIDCVTELHAGSALTAPTPFTLVCGTGTFRTDRAPITLGGSAPTTRSAFSLGPVTKADSYVTTCDLVNAAGSRVWTGASRAVTVTEKDILDATGRTRTGDPLLGITLACKAAEAGIDTKILCTVSLPEAAYAPFTGTSRTGSFAVTGTQSKNVPFTIAGGAGKTFTKEFDLGAFPKPGKYTITASISIPDRGLDIKWRKEATVDFDQHGNTPGEYDVKLKVEATAVAGKMKVVVTPELPDGPAQGDKLQVKVTPLGDVSTLTYAGSAVTVDDLNVPSSTTQTVEATLRQGSTVLATATATLKIDDKGNGSVTVDDEDDAGNPPGGGTPPATGTPPAGTTLDPAPSLNELIPAVDPVQGGKVFLPGLSRLIRQNIQSTKGLAGVLLAFILSFVGVVALFVLVISGFRYITGGGEGAKKAIAGVVIGVIVILGAWVFVTTLLNLGAGPPI